MSTWRPSTASATSPIPESARRLVAAGLARFGRIDAAAAFSGRVITGRFLQSTLDDLHAAVRGCLEAPFHFLQAVLPSMIERGEGQVLVITSAAGARPTPGAPLYSAARAGATMLTRNVAGEVARHGVQVNAVGTNFMDFPEFLRASGADDPAVRVEDRGAGAARAARHGRGVRVVLHAVPRRHESFHHGPVRRVRRRMGLRRSTDGRRSACSTHCNGACARCTRCTTRRSARWASST